jgi:hypothetical protein
MRVRFTENFDYKPTARTTIGYLAGMEETVKRECGEQAIAAKKAVLVPGPAPKAENDGA